MEETQDELERDERWCDQRYVKSRLALLLVMVGLLVVVFNILQKADSLGKAQGVFSEWALRGDMNARLSFAYHYWSKKVPRRPKFVGFPYAKDDFLFNAKESYDRAIVEAPWPRYIRRLLIIENALGYGDIMRLVQLLEESAARPEFNKTEQQRLLDEAAMWRAVLLTPGVPREQVREYEKAIRRLGLGWYEHLALAALYRKAGLADQANLELAAAEKSAIIGLAILCALGVTAFLLMLLGMVFLLVYTALKKGNASLESPTRLPPNRGKVAVLLLEVFVFYLITFLAVQMAGSIFLGMLFQITKSDRATFLILATVANYVASGLIGIFYLALRLRHEGWDWEMLGWKSTNLVRNALYGAGGYAAALVLVSSGAVISQVLGKYFPQEQNPVLPLMMQANNLIDKLSLFLLVAVAAPIIEEIFFRGVLLNSFRAVWGRGWAIVLSAVIFASVHPFPVHFLPVLGLGIILGVLAYDRGSLTPSITAHAIQNIAVFSMLLLLTGS